VAKACERELKSVDREYDAHKFMYEMEVDDALYNLIGNPIKTNKNFNEHKKLYDGMRDYFMESGNLSDYTHDAWLMKEQWQDHWDTKFIDSFTNISVPLLSKQRLKSMFTDFNKIKKQRDKAIKKADKKDGMSSISRGLLPPSILAMKYDRYGFVSKIVRGTKNLSDKVKQSWNTFDSKVAESLNDYRLGIDDIYESVDETKILDGIHELIDSEGKTYSITKVTKDDITGIKTYSIRYNDDERTIKRNSNSEWARENMSDEKFKEQLILKYRDDLVNDILHGQTRKITWGSKSAAKNNKSHRMTLDEAEYRREIRNKHIDEALEKEEDINVSQKSDKIHAQDINILDEEGNPVFSGRFEFVMVKNGEATAVSSVQGEEYSGYILSVIVDGQTIYEGDARYDHAVKMMQEHNSGWHKSNEEYIYNGYQNKPTHAEMEKLGLVDKKGFINKKKYMANADLKHKMKTYYKTGSHASYKKWTNFEKLPTEQQPDEAMLSARVGKKSIHGLVADYRNVYKDVSKDISNFANKNEKRRNMIEMRMMNELRKKGYSEEDARYWIDTNIFAWAGMATMGKVVKDNNGNTLAIKTPDGYFQTRQQNFAPVQYSKQEYNLMLAEVIRNTQLQIEQLRENGEDTKDLEKDLEGYKTAFNLDAQQDLPAEVRDSASSVHLETRKTWTNSNRRKRNAQVHIDYLDKTYRNLHRNELVIDLMEQMINLLKTEKQIPKGSMDYMVNRVKLAFGRDDVNTNIFGIETNNTKIANAFNKMPKWMRLGREWDSSVAEKMWLTLNGVLTMKFLGAGGAVANRTQSINNIISYGFKNWLDARKVMNQDKDKWDRIIANTGVENLLSMFNDIMLQGGDVEWYDAGFLPYSDKLMKSISGFDVPIPTKPFLDWARIRKAGKDKFIQNTSDNNVIGMDIDAVLLRIMNRNLQKDNQRDVEFARLLLSVLQNYDKGKGLKFSDLPKELQNDLGEKRRVYWDLMEMDKEGNTREAIEKLMQNLLGDVDDNLLKKMVTFKLAYWKKGLGEELFTFTEGEQAMRRETVVQALLVADSNGLLGSGKDRFMSPAAVKIGRDAVYQMMFGMSPVYLGESFSGLGRGVMQYKSYPLFQYIKDQNTVENYWNGGGVAENLGRLLQAGKVMATTPDSRINDKDLDQDAIAMIRMLMTRSMASVLSTAAHLNPMMSGALRTLGVGQLLRSAENPLFGLMSRTLVWGVMFGMGWGDVEDEEKMGDEALNKWMYLFTPTILGYFARMGYDGIHSINNAEGIFGIFD